MKTKHLIKDVILTIFIRIFIPLLQLTIRLLGFRKVSHLLDKLIAVTSCNPKYVNDEVTIASNINRYKNFINKSCKPYWVSGNCLAKSLGLSYLLKRKNIKTSLKFGHKRSIKGSFKAHAWLEYNGIPINESADIHMEYVCFEQSLNKL